MNATVLSMPKGRKRPEITMLTPEMAMALLDHNTLNRPLSQPHVNRIAEQIRKGKWKFNGDTIKVAKNKDVIDGQHRCWAVVEAKIPVETIIVYDVEPEAFATIDTLRKPRSGSDILAVAGLKHRTKYTSAALSWLVRYQRKAFETGIRRPENRVENSDIEEAYAAHPQMVDAVDRVIRLHNIIAPSLMAFIYYISANRNQDLAERMVDTLDNPAGVNVTDPFFKLRAWLLDQKMKSVRMDPITTTAVAIKALNAAAKGQRVDRLSWRTQGPKAEQFPKLTI